MATGTIKAPAVVEVGINNSCRYEKFSDGTYNAKWAGIVSFEAGSAWMNGYFHRSSVITAPSFSLTVDRVIAGMSSANLAIYCGCNIINKNDIRLYFYNASSPAETGRAIMAEIIGTWA